MITVGSFTVTPKRLPVTLSNAVDSGASTASDSGAVTTQVVASQDQTQSNGNLVMGIAGLIAGGVLASMATKKKMIKHKVGRAAIVVLGAGVGGVIGNKIG